MTKQEAIENHRKKWRWIAEQIRERKEPVFEYQYFKENELGKVDVDCYCCEYARNERKKHGSYGICVHCPISWGNKDGCMKSEEGPYKEWFETIGRAARGQQLTPEEIERLSVLADQMAMLKGRE